MIGYEVSERRACRIVGLSRTVRRYQKRPRNDDDVIEVLRQLAERHPLWGFGKMYDWIRNEGYEWNRKRVYRVYCALNLNLRITKRKRLPTRHPVPLEDATVMNHSWSMDFMSDALQDGRTIRTLNIIDDFNREALAIEVDTSLPAARVIRVLERLADFRGYPARIRVDNGPEFTSSLLRFWAEQHDVHLAFIQPGRPMQNAYIERFNRTYREEVLNYYVFHRLSEVRAITQNWITTYNEERPHDALGGLTPVAYAKAKQL
jgi:putative transposase